MRKFARQLADVLNAMSIVVVAVMAIYIVIEGGETLYRFSKWLFAVTCAAAMYAFMFAYHNRTDKD